MLYPPANRPHHLLNPSYLLIVLQAGEKVINPWTFREHLAELSEDLSAGNSTYKLKVDLGLSNP